MTRKQSLARLAESGLSQTDAVVEALRPLSRPLRSDVDLDPLMERIGDARHVLLGEASHGTSEFYTWRARLSRRLIEEKGFSFLAVEGDWPDFERINRFVKEGSPGGAGQVLGTIRRWPTWMWANDEVRALAEWLRDHNARRPPDRRVGWYGLDVYSLWESMELVVRHLDRVDPGAARRARLAYECFAPYEGDAERYAHSIALSPGSCEDAVVKALLEVRRAGRQASGPDRERAFLAEQNALIARDAERYYRAMIRGGPHSWNVRDQHMTDTLDRLMAFHGPGARAIVWAHNTHVGDARHTDMADAGEFNLGQQARERHGDQDVVLVGFSTHQGTVIAGDAWGEPMRTMTAPPGRQGSVEDVLHRLGQDSLLLFDPNRSPDVLLAPRGHRAIGVVYRPEVERFGNYVPTVLPRRYDALLHIDQTRALTPLPVAVEAATEPPETYPSGV